MAFDWMWTLLVIACIVILFLWLKGVGLKSILTATSENSDIFFCEFLRQVLCAQIVSVQKLNQASAEQLRTIDVGCNAEFICSFQQT